MGFAIKFLCRFSDKFVEFLFLSLIQLPFWVPVNMFSYKIIKILVPKEVLDLFFLIGKSLLFFLKRAPRDRYLDSCLAKCYSLYIETPGLLLADNLMDMRRHVHLSLKASLRNLLFTMDSAPSSDPVSSTASSHSKKGRKHSGPYRGVRMRAWGKWVSEIRIPKTGKRIWLGSYDSPEKAARAYDAAQFCIRGMHAPFNFPAEERPELPQGYLDPLSKKEIQTIAMNYASSDLPMHAPVSSPVTNQVSIDTPAIPNALNSGATTTASETVRKYAPVSAAVAETPLFENLVLDDFLMLDIEWISEIM